MPNIARPSERVSTCHSRDAESASVVQDEQYIVNRLGWARCIEWDQSVPFVHQQYLDTELEAGAVAGLLPRAGDVSIFVERLASLLPRVSLI